MGRPSGFSSLHIPKNEGLQLRFTNIICVLLVTLVAKSQNLHRPLTPVYTGLGAYSTEHNDILSFAANQAALAQLKNAAVAVYAERKFTLAELNNYSAVLGLPTASGSFGLKAVYAGFSDYNETQLGLAYGRKLGKKIDVGAQFNYNGIGIAGYGNASALSFETGMILHISDKLHTGLHCNNPVGGKFGKDQQEKLSSEFSLGFGYDASDKFFLSAKIVREESQPIDVNVGFQYKFIQQLQLRAGLSTATTTFWAGLGLSWKSTRFDATASYHPQLGLTPGLLLIYQFNSKED